MPAIWRMQARLPRLAALKFVVLLRRPEVRLKVRVRSRVRVRVCRAAAPSGG